MRLHELSPLSKGQSICVFQKKSNQNQNHTTSVHSHKHKTWPQAPHRHGSQSQASSKRQTEDPTWTHTRRTREPRSWFKISSFSYSISSALLVQCLACLWKQNWSYWRNPPDTALSLWAFYQLLSYPCGLEQCSGTLEANSKSNFRKLEIID